MASEAKQFFGWLTEICSTHPRLTRRVRAIGALAARDNRALWTSAEAPEATHPASAR